MKLARLLATPLGRILRIVLGFALIWIGLAVLDKPLGWVVEFIGLAPVITGFMNIFLLGPFFGLPLKGTDAK